MSLNELAANEQRTVQYNFSPNYNFNKYYTEKGEQAWQGRGKEIKSKMLSRSPILAQITKKVFL